MGGTDLEIQVSESERVYVWRVRELRRAGFDELDAELLALDESVDLHRAVDMVADGCDPHLAAKILS